MVAAVYAIAVMMIAVGGYLAKVGYDIVLVERGWTQVIAGSMVLTGGFILLGIAVVVSKLATIDRSLKSLRVLPGISGVDVLAEAATVAPAPAAVVARPEDIPEETTPMGEAAVATEAVALVDVEEPASADAEMPEMPMPEARQDDGGEPKLADLPADFLADISHDIDISRDIQERLSREITPRESFSSATAALRATTAKDEAGVKKTDHDLDFGLPEIVPSKSSEYKPFSWESKARPSGPLEDPLEDNKFVLAPPPVTEEPAKEQPAVAKTPPAVETYKKLDEKPAAHVVGSYDSGGNRYVMYSDGSIEAHLPDGVRSFTSLEELKKFVNKGKQA